MTGWSRVWSFTVGLKDEKINLVTSKVVKIAFQAEGAACAKVLDSCKVLSLPE